MRAPNVTLHFLKTVQWCLLSVLLFPALACDSGPVAPENAGLGYFPLQVGNRWTYGLVGSDSSVTKWRYEIVGKKRIGRYDYFILQRSFEATGFVDSTFYRPGPGGQIFVNRDASLFLDELYIDFGRAPGQKWHSFGEYEAWISRKGFTKRVPAGVFNNCVEVAFDIPGAVDDEFWDVYAPGVGLIEMNSAWISGVKLQSAVVNGVRFP